MAKPEKKAATKAAEKTKSTKGATAPKGKRIEKAAGDGVIGTILKALRLKNGASINEIGERLATQFPERNAEGMKNTARIQMTRLPKRGYGIEKTKDEKRGMVYRLVSEPASDSAKAA